MFRYRLYNSSVYAVQRGWVKAHEGGYDVHPPVHPHNVCCGSQSSAKDSVSHHLVLTQQTLASCARFLLDIALSTHMHYTFTHSHTHVPSHTHTHPIHTCTFPPTTHSHLTHTPHHTYPHTHAYTHTCTMHSCTYHILTPIPHTHTYTTHSYKHTNQQQ